MGDAATVVVYYPQPTDVAGGFGYPKAEVVVDGQEVAKLKKDSFVRLAVTPGRHAFWSKKSKDQFALDLQAGRTYYIRLVWASTGLSRFSQLFAVCPETGQSETAFGRLEEITAISASKGVQAAPAAPAAAAAAEGTALVTVYRPFRSGGEALNTSAYVDGVELAELDEGEFIQFEVPAGAHKFFSDQKKDTFEFQLDGGRAYFLRIGLIVGVFKGHGRIQMVPPFQALAELQQGPATYAKDLKPVSQPKLVAADAVTWPVDKGGDAGSLPADVEKAKVTVFFPRPEASSGVSWVAGARKLSVDDRLVAKVDDGRFFQMELEPGAHRFTAKDIGSGKPFAFELELKGGREYFFRLDLDGPIYPVCGEQGSSEIQGRMQPVKAEKVLDGSTAAQP